MNLLDNCIDDLVGNHKYSKAYHSCIKEMAIVMTNIIYDPEKSLSHLKTVGLHYKKLNFFLEKYPVLQTVEAERELREIRQDMCDFCKILKSRRC